MQINFLFSFGLLDYVTYLQVLKGKHFQNKVFSYDNSRFLVKYSALNVTCTTAFFYSILLSLFKSNMSVARRLAHKFSLTCHNRFIAGCCRSGGLLNTRVHSHKTHTHTLHALTCWPVCSGPA